MNKRQKEMLLEYLFGAEHIRQFLINDLYEELSQILPTEKIFNNQNKNDNLRMSNYYLLCDLIDKFLIANRNYEKFLSNHYDRVSRESLIDDVLLGFTFFISQTNKNYADIDILKDKTSVCFAEVSIIDIMS